jgi:hypothetical protein
MVLLGVLSRVEMNALWAPLTALLRRVHKCVLDEADDFIDGEWNSGSSRSAAGLPLYGGAKRVERKREGGLHHTRARIGVRRTVASGTLG